MVSPPAMLLFYVRLGVWCGYRAREAGGRRENSHQRGRVGGHFFLGDFAAFDVADDVSQEIFSQGLAF